jgi:hypothetical protein
MLLRIEEVVLRQSVVHFLLGETVSERVRIASEKHGGEQNVETEHFTICHHVGSRLCIKRHKRNSVARFIAI